jgi:hypothetical protein
MANRAAGTPSSLNKSPPFNHEIHTFSRVGQGAVEPIPDSVKDALLDGEVG